MILNHLGSAQQPQSSNLSGLTQPATTPKLSFSKIILWVFTWCLTHLNKLPIINKIIPIIRAWYGRTTWWKLIGYLHKFFIVLNAIIGGSIVLDLTALNFPYDSWITTLQRLFDKYVEVLTNIFSRFNTSTLQLSRGSFNSLCSCHRAEELNAKI